MRGSFLLSHDLLLRKCKFDQSLSRLLNQACGRIHQRRRRRQETRQTDARLCIYAELGSGTVVRAQLGIPAFDQEVLAVPRGRNPHGQVRSERCVCLGLRDD